MSYLSAFRVSIESVEEACLVRVRGELDRSRAEDLADHLRKAREVGSTTLVDLHGVSFIDSFGVQTLLHETDAAAALGRATFIVRPSPVVRRLLALFEGDDRLVVVPANDDLSLLRARRSRRVL